MKKFFVSKRIFFVGIIFCSASLSSIARISENNFPSVESSVGMTRVSELSLSQNPAQLSDLDSSVIASAYTPSGFGLRELSTAQILYGQKILSWFNSAAEISGRNSELFSEINGSIVAGAQITEKISFGASLNYSRFAAKNYLPLQSISFDIGGILSLTDFLSAGFSLRNISRASYTQDSKNISQQALFGFGIKVTEEIFLDADARILFAQSSGVNLALRYDPLDFLKFRIAASTYPRMIEAGVAGNFSSIGIRTDISYHDILGFSERIGVAYAW